MNVQSGLASVATVARLPIEPHHWRAANDLYDGSITSGALDSWLPVHGVQELDPPTTFRALVVVQRHSLTLWRSESQCGHKSIREGITLC